MRLNYKIFFLFILLAIATSSCIDLVDEGIDIDYAQSDAQLSVEPIELENGAVDETISYQITVSSSANIKSCIIQSTNPGQNGSGFDVASPGFNDPFIDHIFGTVQKNTKSFTVKYDYIIPQDINKSRLTFSIIDDLGKVSTERTIEVVPGVSNYTDKKLYARDKNFNDAFASIEGVVYPDIKTNYSTLSEENVEVQKKIDIVFFYDVVAKRSVIAAPSSSAVGLSLNVENNTLFKKLNGIGDLDLNRVTPAFLINLTEEANIFKEGASQINNISVGDVIGFVTDLNAIHPLKTGMLKVNGLHPASVPHYEGVSYVLECDIIVQK